VNSTDLHRRFRSAVGDESKPYLWSDDDIFYYANAAQVELCRPPMFGIADATSVVTVVPVTAGEAFSKISPSIRLVRGASLKSTGRELPIYNYNDMLSGRVESDYGIRVRTVLSNDVGPVRSGIIGVEDNKLRWNCVPSADDEVNLVVYRAPTTTISDFDQELELGEDFLEGYLLWMKHLAYGKQDAEAFDRGKADTFLVLFREYTGRASAEQRRKIHKSRLIQYGGI
jgi:hypothetical protein